MIKIIGQVLIIIRWIAFNFIFIPIFLISIELLICFSFYKKSGKKRQIVFGSTPILTNYYWSLSLKRLNYISETFTTQFYNSINTRDNWDLILEERLSYCPGGLKKYFAFLLSLFKYDIFIISFDGFFLSNTPFEFLQARWFHKAGKKVIVIPYGADSYVYSQIRSVDLIHALLMSYPQKALEQDYIKKRVSYWVKEADVLVPGLMSPDGYGRWDVNIPSPIMIDLNQWEAKKQYSENDGRDGFVCIVHAPNHRGFKGTEFICKAVENLKNKGYKIDFILLEKIQNSEVKRIFFEKADILVEQIIFSGHGLNGLEGMATGIPTVSNLEDETYIRPFRRWSYFSECPLVSGSPETLESTLEKLITSPELRKKIGKASRQYVEKYHGLDSAAFLFESIFKSFEDKSVDLINLYHPILGKYPNRSPKISSPLVNNRIPN